MFYAHSTKNPDQENWQSLTNHLLGVADLAEAFGARFGIEKAARLAGLLHDLGKYTPEFQARLTGSILRVDHSTAGAWQVLQLARGRDQMVGELIAFAIAGHHAGLPDKSGLTGSLEGRVKSFSDKTLDPIWQQQIAHDAANIVPAFNFGATKADVEFSLAFLGRMIFSCLVDADFKDTEAFYNAVEHRHVDRSWPSLQSLLPQFLAGFDSFMAGLPTPQSAVNALRAEILGHVRSRAAEPTGLFTLTVPTGGGKTLASLAFALDHAKQHGLDRIIYAIPFTSIIDQTADIFRKVLGEGHVLEHHSAIEETKFEGRESRDKLKLAMEDWAAPVIVTTNVQLFESLFAARTSRSRKLHNIARSVIILDEAQTLPRHLLAPCVRVLDELARNYGCTIVLCTATQPALDKRQFPNGLALEGRELAPDPQFLSRALQRVVINTQGKMDNDALVGALDQTPQGLVIVNSRRHAMELFRAGQMAGLEGLVHLTTRQCAAHRRQILAQLRHRLAENLPCRVVATSLVEAGVDFDFPRVWRAEAGLDSVMQAAGRCNREGRRRVEESVVTIFSAPDYPPPPEVKSLSDDRVRSLRNHADLLSPAAMDEYFGEVYWRLGEGLDRKKILADLTCDRTGTNFAYRTVAEKFQMIDSAMVPVIIPWNETAREAIDTLGIEAVPSGAIARELQTFIVQVPSKARNLLLANGHVKFIHENLRADQFAVLQTGSMYTDETGLIWEDADDIGFENMFA